METGYLNHYVITLNSNAIRDAQLYCGTSSEPWNDEDGWDDIRHVTPYLGIRRSAMLPTWRKHARTLPRSTDARRKKSISAR